MLKDKLTILKDFILSNNTYFDTGYAFAEMNYAGIIEAEDHIGNRMAIFPNDTLGDYFYMRLPDKVIMNKEAFYQVGECSKGMGMVTNIILVACMRNVDSDQLLANLLTTLVNFANPKTSITSFIMHSESVLTQELAKIPKDDLQAALQRMDTSYNLVSVNFNFTVPFVFNNLDCIVNPCIGC